MQHLSRSCWQPLSERSHDVIMHDEVMSAASHFLPRFLRKISQYQIGALRMHSRLWEMLRALPI